MIQTPTLEEWTREEKYLDKENIEEIDYWIQRSVHMINWWEKIPATHKRIKEWLQKYKPSVIKKYSPETIPRRTRSLVEMGKLYRPKDGSFISYKYRGRIAL